MIHLFLVHIPVDSFHELLDIVNYTIYILLLLQLINSARSP